MYIGKIAPVIADPSPSPPSARSVAAPSMFNNVEAVDPIRDGENVVPSGADGLVLGVSLDEIEVQFYSPKDVLAFAPTSEIQSS